MKKSAVFPDNKTENNIHNRPDPPPPKKICLRFAELFIWDKIYLCFWQISTTVKILVLHQQELWNYGADKFEQLG